MNRFFALFFLLGLEFASAVVTESINELLKAVQVAATPEMVQMIALSNEIYFHSDFRVGVDPDPGLYPNPFDTLRDITNQLEASAGAVDGLIALPGDASGTSYAADVSLSPSQIALADSILATLFNDLSLTRPTITLSLVVGADSFLEGAIPLLFTEADFPYELFRSDGTPFLFQEPLPIGSELTVTAFTDRTHLPSQLGTGLDVISAELTTVPTSPAVDLDFNGLDDEWELFFFGQAASPFEDTDGDGYHNLQELLEGTNPRQPNSAPNTTALPLQAPPITISQLGSGDLHFETEFPSIYSGQVTFALLTQTNLELPFSALSGGVAADEGNDKYSLVIPKASDATRFYRFRVQFVSP